MSESLPDWQVDRELSMLDQATIDIRNLGGNAAAYLDVWPHDDYHSARDWEYLDFSSEEGVALEFGDFLEIETSFVAVGAGRVLSPEASEALRDIAVRFHDALPFTPAELRWLVPNFRQAQQEAQGRYSVHDAFVRFRSKQGKILSAGRYQPVTGQDLTRRWWSWRRATDEFAASDSYELACKALHDLKDLIL